MKTTKLEITQSLVSLGCKPIHPGENFCNDDFNVNTDHGRDNLQLLKSAFETEFKETGMADWKQSSQWALEAFVSIYLG